MTRKLASLALALTVALALGACGDGANQFREDYNAVGSELSRVSSAMTTTAGDSPSEVATKMGTAADEVAKARAKLAKLEPPEDAKDEFKRLLTSLEGFEQDLRSFSKSGTADPAKALEFLQEVSRSGQEMIEAETALQKAVDG